MSVIIAQLCPPVQPGWPTSTRIPRHRHKPPATRPGRSPLHALTRRRGVDFGQKERRLMMKHALAFLLVGMGASEVLAQAYPYRPVFVRRGRFIYVVRVPNTPYGAPPGAAVGATSLVNIAGPPQIDFAFAAPPAMIA